MPADQILIKAMLDQTVCQVGQRRALTLREEARDDPQPEESYGFMVAGFPIGLCQPANSARNFVGCFIERQGPQIPQRRSDADSDETQMDENCTPQMIRPGCESLLQSCNSGAWRSPIKSAGKLPGLRAKKLRRTD